MKKIFCFLFLCSGCAFTQVPTINWTATPLQEGQSVSITCSANCTSLTWKVNGITGGNATIGTITGNNSTATYTAPASIVANNVLPGGCPVGFNDTVWYVPVSALPLISNWNSDPFLNDAWYIKFATTNYTNNGTTSGGTGMSDAFRQSIGDATTPTVTVNGTANILMPQGPELLREGGLYASHFSGNNDQHLAVSRVTDCFLTEDYGDNPITTSCGTNPSPCYTGSSAAHLIANKYTWLGGIDAGGGLMTPYLIHLSEVKSGVIKHAVHFNLPRGVDSGPQNLMWPATWGTGYCGDRDVVGLTIGSGGHGYSAATTIAFSGGMHSGSNTAPVWVADISGGVITGAHLVTSGHDATGNGLYDSTPTVTITDTGGGTGATATATIDYPCLPYGSRIALDQTYLTQHIGSGTSCPAGSNCLGAAGSPGVVVATALANYGGIVLDNQSNGGGAWLFNAADDLMQDIPTHNAITSALSHLTFNNFHVYDQSLLAKSTAANINYASGCTQYKAGQPCSGESQVVPGNDLNYIPPGAAWVTATNGSGASLPIGMQLQPATVGTADTMLWMLAGDYSGSKGTGGGYQIPYWVHGVSNTSVTWTCATCSANGSSITAGGIYTPPVTLSTIGLQDVAVCTLNADSHVTATVYINLLPNAGNYVANTIRVDTGTSSNLTDGNGHSWLGNIGFYGGDVGTYNNTWKYYSGTGEQSIYNTSMWAYTDMQYKFIVPNGNYHVRVMGGWDYEMWGPAGVSVTAWNHSPLFLWSNDNGYTGRSGGTGGLKALFWNMMEHTAYAPFTQDSNSDYSFGSKVVNNELIVGAGDANYVPGPGFPASNNTGSLPEISGVEILPDGTAPHWTIGVTNGTSAKNPTITGPDGSILSSSVLTDAPVVTVGKNIGLYVQDWYTGITDPTTGTTDAIWKIVSGPGTLSTSTQMFAANHSFPLEIYAPPATPIPGEQPVIVQACSASNTTICAQRTLKIISPSNPPVQFK